MSNLYYIRNVQDIRTTLTFCGFLDWWFFVEWLTFILMKNTEKKIEATSNPSQKKKKKVNTVNILCVKMNWEGEKHSCNFWLGGE